MRFHPSFRLFKRRATVKKITFDLNHRIGEGDAFKVFAFGKRALPDSFEGGGQSDLLQRFITVECVGTDPRAARDHNAFDRRRIIKGKEEALRATPILAFANEGDLHAREALAGAKRITADHLQGIGQGNARQIAVGERSFADHLQGFGKDHFLQRCRRKCFFFNSDERIGEGDALKILVTVKRTLGNVHASLSDHSALQ